VICLKDKRVCPNHHPQYANVVGPRFLSVHLPSYKRGACCSHTRLISRYYAVSAIRYFSSFSLTHPLHLSLVAQTRPPSHLFDMLLFTPPRCDSLLGKASRNQTGSLSRSIFSNPLWPSVASIPLSPRSPKQKPSRPSPPQRKQQLPQSTPSTEMSQIPGTPRSSAFAPTLGSIPEVFEYESLEAKFGTVSLNDAPEAPDAFFPETSASMSPPTLTRATSWPAFIQSPSRRRTSQFAVSKVLRNILEADRVRRRRILKVYLKAIVFLKYLWRANERYGNVMVSTGMYMQR
jgi:hypothetical protein